MGKNFEKFVDRYKIDKSELGPWYDETKNLVTTTPFGMPLPKRGEDPVRCEDKFLKKTVRSIKKKYFGDGKREHGTKKFPKIKSTMMSGAYSIKEDQQIWKDESI